VKEVKREGAGRTSNCRNGDKRGQLLSQAPQTSTRRTIQRSAFSCNVGRRHAGEPYLHAILMCSDRRFQPRSKSHCAAFYESTTDRLYHLNDILPSLSCAIDSTRCSVNPPMQLSSSFNHFSRLPLLLILLVSPMPLLLLWSWVVRVNHE
jgi:hypothetical protein